MQGRNHPRARTGRGTISRVIASAAAAALALSSTVLGPAAADPPPTPLASCEVSFDVTTSEAGFTHPGIGPTAENLHTAREMIRAGEEPWATYFEAMSSSPAANTGATSSNASAADPTVPDQVAFNSQGFNSRFIADGLKAYTQALMYVFTGEQVHRENAMGIIRIWAQMDPEQYALFPDSHIHTGIPMQRMMAAAEILRYGSCDTDTMPWTEQDTELLTTNLVTPLVDTFQHNQNHFMNQHNYPLLGAVAGHIFTDNRPRYEESVEWFTVNSTANDQGFNGSVKRLFRLVERNDATGEPLPEPRVQHVEMGRDQAHGGGDITNAYILSRMLMAQDTLVDPEDGTVSEEPGAVGPYEFLDDRILAAGDYFWRFMLGHETPWTPVGYAISADGTIRDTYDHISNAYRGRYNTAGFWDLYYYYTYERGVDVAEVAPYLHEAFSKRLPPDFYYRGTLNRAWDNVDGGGDFWLYLPAEAAGSSVPRPQTSATELEIEDRFSQVVGEARELSDNGTGFVRIDEGDRIAFLNGSSTGRQFALRVRTDAVAELHLAFGLDHTVFIPDTGGQWRTVTVDLEEGESLQDLLYLETTVGRVDVDSLLIDTSALTQPNFEDPVSRVIGVVQTQVEVTFPIAEPVGEDVVHAAEGLPEGAALDPGTGTLTWTPEAAGRHAVLVSVDDGESVSAHRVELVAADDRTTAIAAAAEGHDAGEVYDVASTRTWEAALATAQEAVSGSDEQFTSALEDLVAAVDGLRLVSPRAFNGSLDYPGLLADSSAGSSAHLLVDGDNQTGTTYGQAVGLGHVFDFGPFAKVTADQFGLQSNIFEDRLANSAVFGSNDGIEWTRLTPGVTTMTQDYQVLEVAPELRSEAFQYLKVEILEVQPDVLYGLYRNLFEFTEFHVYGERRETLGSLDSVSISAPGSLKNRVTPGAGIRLDFHASEPITDVSVSIAGHDVVATSEDGRTWVVEVPLPAAAPVGEPVRFSIDHTTGAGDRADTVLTTSDGSRLYASIDEGIVDEHLSGAPVLGADGSPSSSLATDASRLFDEDMTTHSDTRLVGGRASLTWDLGEGASMAIDGVDLLVRQDQYGTGRLSTLRYEGSHDLQEWVPLTSEVVATPDWQRLTSLTDEAFRYIRLTNGNIINVAETRVFGTHEAPVSDVASASIVSSNSLGNYLVDGDVVTLDIELSQVPSELEVTIDGSSAAVEEVAPNRVRATATPQVADRIGEYVEFTIDHVTADGERAVTMRQSTDGSRVRLGTDAGLVRDLMDVSTNVTLAGEPDPSSVARPADLFDGDLGTYTDARMVAGSADIIFDLGEEAAVSLERVELALRQDDYGLTRLRNLQIQSSDDLTEWTTLVTDVRATLAWQGLAVPAEQSGQQFRYLRITNGHILGIAELRLYGAVSEVIDDGATELPGVGQLSATSGWATGLHDGYFDVRMNLWWGSNGSVFRLYENDELIATEELVPGTPSAQVAAVSIAGRPNGTYVYTGELVNAMGATATTSVTVEVTDAAPGMPQLSHDNWDGDGDFTISADLWWGTNATQYRLFEDGELVDSRELVAASPQAQHVSSVIEGRAPGSYSFVVELANEAGVTRTEPITVRVR